MAKIEVGLKDSLNPKPKVDALVSGQDYPFQVALNHERKPGVVLPIIGVYDIIPKGTDYVITLQSYQQAWDLVAQMAHIADLFKKEQIAVITVASAEAPAAPQKRPKEAEVKA